MQLTPQEEQIYAVLSRILVEDFEVPAEKISLDGRLFEDYDIDSIDAVDMIVQLKPHLGRRRVKSEDFRQVRTLGDVVRVVGEVLSRPESASEADAS